MTILRNFANRMPWVFSWFVVAAGLSGLLLGGMACEGGGPQVGAPSGGDADGDGDGDADSDGDADTGDTNNPGDTSGTGDSDSSNETDIVNVCLGPNPPMDLCRMVSDPACGDGNLDVDERNEECDDGNTLPGDGCTGICKVEPNWECPTPGAPCIYKIECGNGRLEPG